MTKGNKLDEGTREAIRADVRNIKNSGETKKQIAARFNIHPTMISKIMQSNGSKPTRKAKRKTARTSVKANPLSPIESATWENLFNDYIAHRDLAKSHTEEAVAARKRLEAFVKELK